MYLVAKLATKSARFTGQQAAVGDIFTYVHLNTLGISGVFVTGHCYVDWCVYCGTLRHWAICDVFVHIAMHSLWRLSCLSLAVDVIIDKSLYLIGFDFI